jgi:hypothetical protein
MNVLMAFSIDSKILACTHNNNEHAIHGCNELRQELESRNLPCAAWTLKTIIEDGLVNVKPILSKIREFIIEINSNPEMMEDFKHWTEVYQEGSWKLPFNHSANWNDDYNMLDVVKKVLHISVLCIFLHSWFSADLIFNSYKYFPLGC